MKTELLVVVVVVVVIVSPPPPADNSLSALPQITVITQPAELDLMWTRCLVHLSIECKMTCVGVCNIRHNTKELIILPSS